MRSARLSCFLVFVAVLCMAQHSSSQKKHLLVIEEEKGYRHESVSHAMATIEHLGKQTGRLNALKIIEIEMPRSEFMLLSRTHAAG